MIISNIIMKCTTCGSLVGNVGDEELCIKCDYDLLPDFIKERVK